MLDVNSVKLKARCNLSLIAKDYNLYSVGFGLSALSM